MKNILFVASEAVPFIKTGGLADVTGALPKYLDKRYFDCKVILPKYLSINKSLADKMEYVSNFYMDYNGMNTYVGIFKTHMEGVDFYFIDNETYFSGDRIYGDWKWDIEKFIFFSLASLSVLPVIGFKPDVIHCHDWQTGLIPVFLKDRFRGGDFYKDIKSVFTIHNLQFQGSWSVDFIRNLSGLSSYYFTDDKLEAYGAANMLKGGVVYADAVTTVSDSYANEIQESYYGEGLDGLMRARKDSLRGILNGIDYEKFNPETDSMIVANYNGYNFREEKWKNKLALQEAFDLPRDAGKFMLCIISRLTDQKGMALVAHVGEELCNEDLQFIVVGTGDVKYENDFRYLENKYGDKMRAYIGYDEALAQRVYAASDAILMPSNFEPCGLSQLIGLRYGTLPIVREVGGLRDTVYPYNEYNNSGTGFSFANYNAHEMLYTIRYAESVFYHNKEAWNSMISRAMGQDFSWNASTLKYQELYDWLIGY